MSTIYCMNCGVELDSEARFCSVCGSPTLLGLSLAEAEDGKAQVSCPFCGTLNDSGIARCVACGAPLRKAATTTLDMLPSVYYPRYEEPVADTEEARSRTKAIGIVAGALIVVALVGGVFASGILGRRGSDPKVTSPAVESGETGEESPEATEELTPAGTEIRDSLEAYSWEELSIIGKEMSRCTSRDAALDIAKSYNLVDSAGNMSTATKDATLEGIGVAQMRLVDVYHDDLANGEGKAGLTFMAANIPAQHRMNAADDITGGWEASELRSWLNSELFMTLDEDLRAAIVPVGKLTNNVGNTTSATSVTTTIDMLWLPSMVELSGPTNWTWPSDPANSDGYNAVVAAEGSQYALFQTQNVQQLAGNGVLTLSGADGAVAWWERSASCSGTTQFRSVSEQGDPTNIRSASLEGGVCFGFCL